MTGEFTVSQSQEAAEQLIAVILLLRSRGEGVLAARSVRWILEELARTPLEFGESRYHLPNLELHIRIGFAGSCRVDYSVNIPHRRVFIRRWSAK